MPNHPRWLKAAELSVPGWYKVRPVEKRPNETLSTALRSLEVVRLGDGFGVYLSNPHGDRDVPVPVTDDRFEHYWWHGPYKSAADTPSAMDLPELPRG